jgi:predicted ATPase
VRERFTVEVENFGPFEWVEIEVKPLTLLVGRNSVGKSMLMRLLWALLSMPPAPLLALPEDAADAFLKAVAEGLAPPEESVRELVRASIESLQASLAEVASNRLKSVFGVEQSEIVRAGAEAAKVSTRLGSEKPVVFAVSRGGVAVENLSEFLSGLIENLRVEVPAPGFLRLARGDVEVAGGVKTRYDVASLISRLLSSIVTSKSPLGRALLGASFGAFLPDSRAGVLRAAPPPFSRASWALPSSVDWEFVDAVFRFAEALGRGETEWLEPAKDFFRELGCELAAKPVGAAYAIYVKTWSGKEVPLHLAPSGVREAAVVALALLSPYTPIVLVEEPEAHLHPRAVVKLAELVALAVEMGKTVVASTHSDYLLTALNNIIARSEVRAVEGGRLDPADVAAYLVKVEGGKAVVERLEVTDEGIPEDEFARVAEELLSEQARIYHALQKG